MTKSSGLTAEGRDTAAPLRRLGPLSSGNAVGAIRKAVPVLVLATPPLAIVAQGVLINSTPLAVVGCVLLLAAITRFIRRAEAVRLPHICVALLAAALGASSQWPAMHPPPSVPQTSARSLLLGLALLLTAMVYRPPARAAAVVIAVTGGVAAAYLLISNVTAGGRLTGLSLNANYVGTLLAPAVVAALGLAWQTKRLWWLAVGLPSLGALWYTQSRGALMALAMGLLLLVAAAARRWYRLILAAGGALVVLGLLVVFAAPDSPMLTDRDPTQMRISSGIRWNLAKAAVSVAVGHPLRGIGLGMFPWYAKAVGLGYYNTHNDYLRVAAEAGLPALALFGALLWFGLWRRRTGDLAVLRATVACYAVNMLFVTDLALVLVSAAFWVSLGCLIGGGTASARPDPEATVRLDLGHGYVGHHRC